MIADRESQFRGKMESWDPNHTVKFSKATMRRVKKGNRRVHRRESFKSAIPNSRKERKTKP